MFNRPRALKTAFIGLKTHYRGRRGPWQFLPTGRQLTRHGHRGIALDAGGQGGGSCSSRILSPGPPPAAAILCAGGASGKALMVLDMKPLFAEQAMERTKAGKAP
ncbi:MAG: hypothetical protein PHH32_08155, partial [Eubacteriales bacterium]|nr:hypothetical protein [Eubacteriales bacterium]